MNEAIFLFQSCKSVYEGYKESFVSYRDISMDTNNEIISKLKFIGKLREGEKINVRHLYVQQPGFMTRISRTLLHVDNRKNTYTFIVKTLDRSFDIIYSFLNSDKVAENQLAKNVIKDMQDCRQGIKNLQRTYKDDIMFCCDIDTLLQNINAKLSEIKDKYPSIYPSENRIDSCIMNEVKKGEIKK